MTETVQILSEPPAAVVRGLPPGVCVRERAAGTWTNRRGLTLMAAGRDCGAV